jgi:uncharacterized cofD-like protein
MSRTDEPRIVAIGGGTGLATLLRGLKRLTTRLTAIVTVTDDGGSSGRLRKDLGVLPPGDVRNCMVALADDESLMGELFSYRFATGELAGHSFGNLFLAALTEVTGDFDLAIRESSRVLAISGTVLPSTTSDVHLHALLSDGRELVGESVIGRAPVSVTRVWIEPADAQALPLALERIAEADVVVLGPGSLFTSIVPNLLVRGVAEALAATAAQVVYIVNVMTQPGETAAFGALDHLDGLLRHLEEGVVDVMVVNQTPVPPRLLARYAEEGAEPVVWSGGELHHRGVRIAPADLLRADRLIRHDPDRLARLVVRAAGAPE